VACGRPSNVNGLTPVAAFKLPVGSIPLSGMLCVEVVSAGRRSVLPPCSLLSAAAWALAGSIASSRIPAGLGVAGAGLGSVAFPATSATNGEGLRVGLSMTAGSAADVAADSGLAGVGATVPLSAATLCTAPLSLRVAGVGPTSPTERGMIGFTGVAAPFSSDVRSPVVVGLPAADAVALDTEERTVPGLRVNMSC
jgi:hypothetical protein